MAITRYLPYSTQTITQADIDAVTNVLQSGWLTGGQTVEQFEMAMASYCGSVYGVAVNSGTAALHSCLHAINLQPGDEVIVPAISFAATANAVVYEGGRPVFCDVLADTLLLDCDCLENLITNNTRAIIAVDYAGQLCDYEKLRTLCDTHNLTLIADGCHSLGAEHNGLKSGNLADLTAFSFHPVKQITTGEGGMVMTNSEKFMRKVKKFRNHGIDISPAERSAQSTHVYDIEDLGYNYRLSDIHAGLGLSQLTKFDNWLCKRRQIARRYDLFIDSFPSITSLSCSHPNAHAHHLYVVMVPQREKVFRYLREKSIGVNVHYKPIYLHSFYTTRFKTSVGLCPVAEKAYASVLSLPIFPDLTLAEQQFVMQEITHVVASL